jgi:hypothetical protein
MTAKPMRGHTTTADWAPLATTWAALAVGFTHRFVSGAAPSHVDARDCMIPCWTATAVITLVALLDRPVAVLWWLSLAPVAGLMLYVGYVAAREVVRARRRGAIGPITGGREWVLVITLVLSAGALPVAFVAGVLSRDGETVRLSAVAGTLLGTVLHEVNGALYRRWRSPDPDPEPVSAAR